MSSPGPAVFLSYASQDAEAARRIADALRAAGVEVWFDQNELVGGDAWDAKIRKQIAECALFVPVISANTQARREGYFRLEWRIAAQRTHMMSEQVAFLLPVVVDDTRDAVADVPTEFKAVQWTRLPAGEAAEKFCVRVKRLLIGDVAGVADPGPASPKPAATKPPRRWRAPAALALAAVVALALWQPWRAKEKAAPTSTSPVSVAPAAPASEAGKLVAKARAILDGGDEMNREVYALAEDLLKRAEQLDVTEASAWALHAWLSADLYRYGLDRTEVRLSQIQTQASRAISLAPSSLDAQLAMLRSQTASRSAPEDIARRQIEIADKFPGDPRVYRLFGLSHAKDSVTFKMLERGLSRWPDDPRLQGDMANSLVLGGRYAEADEMVEKFTRRPTGARVLTMQAFLQLWWRGDSAAAASSVARWPAWFLLEDRGAGMAAITALMNRTPESALEVLRRFPRDYLRDSFFTGPRSALLALASEAAGQSESAAAEWRVVLQVCDRELVAVPNDGAALHWKAWALARLGQKTEAQQIFRVLAQRRVAIEGSAQVTGGLAGLALALGNPEEALHELGRLGTYDPQRTRPPTRALFDLNPLFDPLRGDPRFKQLRDAAPAPGPSGVPVQTADDKSAPADKSVAVLPFANLSGDAAQEYFSDGLTEEILNALARERALRVPGRTSSFSFKGRNVPAAEIARALNVSRLVEGSVRRSGSKVRISVSLTRASDGFSEELGTFTEELTDIFALQDKVASAVVAKLTNRAVSANASVRRAINPEAYGLYLQARAAWTLRTLEGHQRAEQCLARALALEPGYAPAMALRSMNYTQLGGQFRSIHPEAQAEAVEWADRALATDPGLAEALGAKAFTLSVAGDYAGAVRLLRRSIEIDPGFATGHQLLGRQLAAAGDIEGALAALRTAAQLDPLAPRILDNYASVLAHAGRAEEALKVIDDLLAAQPTWEQGIQFRARFLFLLGRLDEALDLYLNQSAARRDLAFAVRAFLAAGRRAEAEKLVAEREPGFTKGLALFAMGRPKEALAMMQPPTSVQREFILWEQEAVMPRDLPEFHAALKEWGLDEAWSRAEAWRAAHRPEKREARK